MFNNAIGELTCLASIAKEDANKEFEYPEKKNIFSIMQTHLEMQRTS